MAAKLAAQFRGKVVTKADKAVEDAGRWGIPDPRTINAGGKAGRRGASGFCERAGIVGPGGGKDAIVTRNGGAHTEIVEEPRTEGSQKPRLKIEVKERLRFGLLMAAKELREGRAAEMMNHAGGQKYVAGAFRRKGVLLQKAAGQAFGGGQTISFRYQRGVEIQADQFNVVISQGNIGGEPPYGIANAASHVGDAQCSANASLTNGSDDAAKKFPYAMTVIELFGQTLHLPMDGEEQRVDGSIVENAGGFGQSLNRAQCLAIVKSRKDFEELLFADGQALVCLRIVLND